jgi:ribosomal protein S12 methylthiotransferase
MESLVQEAKDLADKGVKELILVAQETTLYGMDLYGKKSLPELLHKLAQIPGIFWIRILYCYPEEITDELIQTIKEEPKVCKYLDIPIQHASDAVLKRMGRRTNQQEIRDIVEKLRREIPDICLRTTLITGFPGETQEDHEEVYNFVNEMEFDRLGVFTYSAEEDTPAYSFDNQIPEDVKVERKDAVLQMQQDIAFDSAYEKMGYIFDVLVEGYIPDEEVYVGRTYMDAPGVDGYIFFKSNRQILSGDFVKVEVTDAKGYDLIGEIIG